MAKKRQLTCIITLADGISTCSYLGRVSEFPTEEEFVAQVRIDCDENRPAKVRQCYARVCICATGQDPSYKWHMEEYQEPGPGKFLVWWWDL